MNLAARLKALEERFEALLSRVFNLEARVTELEQELARARAGN